MGRTFSSRAFTLIELLVVVAIIGLLIAILLPSLSTARAQAQKVRCGTNLRTLAQMDLQYANLNNDMVVRNSGTGATPSVFYLLATMNKIPLVTVPATSGFESQYRTAYSKIKWFNCPAFPVSGQPVSFVTNGFNPANVGSQINYVKIERMRRKSDTVNFADANANIPADEFNIYDLWDRGHLMANVSTRVTAGSTVGRILSDKRHRNAINLSFYDGHVDSKPYKKVALWDFVN